MLSFSSSINAAAFLLAMAFVLAVLG